MRISTKRSDLPLGKYLGSKVKSLGLIVPILFLLMNFQTVWSQQFTTLDLLETVDQVTWTATAGDMVNGFEYCLDPAVTYYYLNTAATTATDIAVSDGMYPFTVTSYPTGWFTYWAGKGVDANITGDWTDQMWLVINGNAPIFYLKAVSGSFSLIDGLQYDLSSGAIEDYLRINGDYLVGNYTYTGNLGGASLSFDASVGQYPTVSASVGDYNGYGVSCAGDSDGSIDLTVTGAGVYDFMWNDGVTTQNRTGVPADVYDVNVSTYGCSVVASAIYVNGPPALTLSLAASNYNGYEVAVFGGSNGEIAATVSGGAGVYAYDWDSGQSTAGITGLVVGGYQLTVTDENNCTISDGEILSQPNELEAVVVSYENVDCYGNATGSIDMDVSGGVPPYFYNWSEATLGPISVFTADAGNLVPGEYTLNVVDINGATVTSISQSIAQPLAMSATLIKSDVVCQGDGDGSIEAITMGGVGPYTFVWYRQSNLNDSLFVETSVYSSLFDGLVPDAYCVTIEDANGCNITVCEIIEEPPVLYAWTVAQSDYFGFNVSCFGADDGWVDIEVSGGVLPYDYAWGNNYANTQDGSGLWAGPWGVWVEDGNGCDYVLQWVLDQPAEIIANAWVTDNVSCNGFSDGGGEAIAAGGEGTLSIQWLDAFSLPLSPDVTGNVLANQPAGIYSILVTDSYNGCTTNDVGITVGTPSWNFALTGYSHSIAVPTANISINGSAAQNGDYIGVFFDGGTGCAGYAIIDGATTIVTAWGDDAQTTIKDGMAFGEAFTWKIFRPFAGEFDVLSPSYNLAFDPGNYAAGATSQVSLFETTGSLPQSVISIEITEPTVLEFSAAEIIENVSCFGFNDGSIDITVDGGTLPYIYTWATTNGSGLVAGDEDQTDLTAGDYSVTIVDDHSCTIYGTYTVTEPLALTLAHDSTYNVLCKDGNEGALFITVGDGTPLYTYLWTTADGSIPVGTEGNEDIFGLTDGSYDVLVTDDHGCVISLSGLMVTEPDLLELNGGSTTNVSCFGGSNGTITINDATGGTSPYIYLWTTTDGVIPMGTENDQNLTNLIFGTYEVFVTDANFCTTLLDSYTITQPDELVYVSHSTSDFNGFNVPCYGDDVATIDLIMAGGTDPLSYLWDSGATTSFIDNLDASMGNTYSCTITDALGCEYFFGPVVLTEPTELVVTSITTSDYNGYGVHCNGDLEGWIDLEVDGGVTVYGYNWNTGTYTSQDLSGLGIGMYEVVITDANGCIATTNATITEPTLLEWSAGGTQSEYNGILNSVSCYGSTDGWIDIFPTGGLPLPTDYTFYWETSDGTGLVSSAQNQANLGAGTYNVTVTDQNGCTITDSFTLTQPDQIVITASTTQNVSCYGLSDGEITTSVVSGGVVGGGVGPFTYIWSNGSTDATVSGLPAGLYDVTITDLNGCESYSGVDNTIPWSFTNTGFNHTIFIPDASSMTYGGGPLMAGDYIGVFYDSLGVLYNAGYGEFTGDATTVVAWGDDIATPAKDGFVDGDEFFWKIWRPFVGDFDATPAYIDASTSPDYSNEGFYAQFGMSGLTTLTNNENLFVVDVSFTEITQPELLVTSIMVDGLVQCTGGVTDIYSTTSGGTELYTYEWSNGAISADLIGVPAGIYDLTVTDDHGCIAYSNSVTITGPTPLTVSTVSTTDAICFGDNTATIVIVTMGGYSPYTEDWGAFNPLALAAGTYTVTITDAEGCSTTYTESVGEAVELTASGTETPVTCFNGLDGSIVLDVFNGTAPYTFIWSTGAITQDLTGILAAATYDVTITDYNGCMTTTSVEVTQPTMVTISGSAFEYTGPYNVSCNGASDGEITVVGDGGVGGYTYEWSPGGLTDATITGIPAGTYTATVWDSNMCPASTSFTLIQPDVLLATATITSSYEIPAGSGNFYSTSCNGMDGSIGLAVYGGAGPFEFVWSYGQTDQNLSGIPAGTYYVDVVDDNGCTVTSNTVVLNTPGPQNVTITSAETYPIENGFADIRCNGGNGSINVTWDQGVGPFDIYWSDWNILETLDTMTQTYTQWSSFSAGTYWVAIYDSNGCGQLSNILDITEPDPIVPAPGIFNVNCFGGADGYIDLSLTTGGSGPGTYLFQWDGAANFLPTPTLTGLSAGDTPYVVVWDDNNCSEGFQFVVTEPALLEITSIDVTNALCFGTATGVISPVVTGGTPPFTFSTDGVDYFNELIGIAAGTYDVYIKDANDCVAIGTATVGQPLELQASISVIDDVSCFGGSDGKLTTTTTDGTPPYFYSWEPPVGTSVNTEFQYVNVTAGTYTVTVTDSNGCEVILTGTVNQPDELVLSAVEYATSCVGSADGSIDLTVAGGTQPWTYLWPAGVTTEDIDNLVAGIYPVIVTDAEGCVASGTYEVFDAPAIVITGIVTDASCNGVFDGEIDLTVTGGDGTYTYLWSPNGETDADLTLLGVGSYSVQVTDGNGCIENETFEVGHPDVLGLTFDITNVTCFGGNDGGLIANVSGGTAPYGYDWNIGPNDSNNPNLISGNYLLVVTDVNGCQISDNAFVNEPALIVLDFTVTNVSCNGLLDGEIALAITGGTVGSTFEYAWDNNEISQNLTGLAAGTYSVIVTESTGCTMSGSVTITEPTPLSVTITSTNVVCFGDQNGTVLATPVGGTSLYNYVWTPGGEITDNISGLAAGNYSVEVTDANGCIVSAPAIIEEAAPLSLTLTVTDVQCNLDVDGSIELAIVGGATPFTFEWTDVNHTNTQNLLNVGAGSYTVTVTDANGCVGVATGEVLVTDPFVIDYYTVSDVSCNEANDDQGIPGSVSQNGSVFVQMIGGHYNFEWKNSGGFVVPNSGTLNATNSTLSNVPAGVYYLQITSLFSSCVMDEVYEVFAPAALTIGAQITNASCYKFNDGSVLLDVAGGTLAYTYQWTNGANVIYEFEDLMGVKAGTYKIVVTDANGCVNLLINEITQPALLTSSINASDVTCNGYNDGSMFVDIDGGTMPYSYIWSNGGTTNSINNLAAMAYNVAVTDINGCSLTDDGVIEEPSILAVTAVGTDLTCFESNDGAAYADVTGGTFPYTFEWSNGPLNDFIQNVAIGNYSVEVTDANGCSAIDDVDLIQPTAMDAITFTQSTIGTLVFVEASTTGGTLGYTYLWSTGSVDASILVSSGNTYTVTIYDANMCSVEGTFIYNTAPTGSGQNGQIENTSDISDLEISVYPNPSADGRFVIDLGQFSSENVQLQVVDGFGKIIKNSIISGGLTNQIELQLQVAKGVYYLKIITEENGSVTKSLVITE